MSELTITASQAEGNPPVTILHLSGHLHGATEKELLDYASQSHENGATHLLLDMSDLEVLSSAGLRAIHSVFNLFTPPEDVEIIRQHREEPYKSSYVKLVCPNPQIYYVLNIAGFLQSLIIYNEMDEALKSFA